MHAFKGREQALRRIVDRPPEPANYARALMDVETFCAQSHVLVIAGKGGVGKTTVSAALARMAAGVGLSRPHRRAGGQIRDRPGLRAARRTWTTRRCSSGPEGPRRRRGRRARCGPGG